MPLALLKATRPRIYRVPNAARARLERLLTQQETVIRRAFLRFIEVVNSPAAWERISNRLAAGDVEGALAIVDEYVVQMSHALPEAFTNVGRADVAAASAQIHAVPGVAVALSFDPNYPRAVELMRAERLSFIREFSQAQRDATRQAMVRAFQEGKGALATARSFRESIGLTAFQENAVENYRKLLGAVSDSQTAASAALARDIRDRRFDPTVQRAFDTGQPLTEAQIDRMTSRYRERFLSLRSEAIARTEGVRTQSLAQREAQKQVADSAEIPLTRIRRIWHSTDDARTRDAHRAMDGQEVGFDEPFIDGNGYALMFPGDPAAPPATTINCRCNVSHEILAPGAETTP